MTSFFLTVAQAAGDDAFSALLECFFSPLFEALGSLLKAFIDFLFS
jgi:hypothetical protein